MKNKKIIEFANVSFSYPESPALFKDLSLVFKSDTFYLIKGRSGIGKSSLLRLINRLEEPLAGEVLFKDRPLASYNPQVLRRSIVYIQQTPVAIDGPVKDNLLLPFTFKNNRDLKKPKDDELKALLEDFHLKGVNLTDNAQNLSVGQLQRISFIRGLLLSPEVILLDEPTSSLDEESCRIVESSAEKLCRQSGRAVIMVSHKGFHPQQTVPVVLELADGRLREV
ncbi:MAG: ATP-binding cassette domain-containing protein [Proteobacteria bacterium]|nr:ATP-binding cassette domain-containing protein [Pseudomonadota bacterium]